MNAVFSQRAHSHTHRLNIIGSNSFEHSKLFLSHQALPFTTRFLLSLPGYSSAFNTSFRKRPPGIRAENASRLAHCQPTLMQSRLTVTCASHCIYYTPFFIAVLYIKWNLSRDFSHRNKMINNFISATSLHLAGEFLLA